MTNVNDGYLIQHEVANKVYQILSETEDWWEIKKFERDNTVYIEGQRERESELQILLPLPSQTCLTWTKLEEELRKFPHAKTLTLAIVEADTSVVYYDISSGLVTPLASGKTEETLNPVL